MSYKNIKKIGELLNNSREYFSNYLSSSRAFKHCEKLKLSIFIFMIVRGLHRSIQVELVESYIRMDLLEQLPSKSAFSQGRKKITWELFKFLNKEICLITERDLSPEYRESSPSNLRRVAVDGSTLSLPQIQALDDEFGHSKNQYCIKIQARCCIAYDIDVDQILTQDINAYNVSEKAIATNFIKEFDEKSVLIYDQYYYGFAFCYLHLQQGCHFIMRVYKGRSNAIKKFVDSRRVDQILEIKISDKAYKFLKDLGYEVSRQTTIRLRLVKGWDDEGKEVYYVTDLLDKQLFSRQYINDSYKGRWSAETALDVVKNKIQVECFAGHTANSIKQEFHAAICQYNIVAMAVREANEQLYNEHPEKKANYQVNRNLAVGLIKISFFKLFSVDQHGQQGDQQQWQQLIDILVRFPEPIRPGRKYKRKYTINKMKGKYYTHTNYRRAV